MAFERSWLSVVEVARESRRRFSGRKDVMVMVDGDDGHEKGADASEQGVCLKAFRDIASYLTCQGRSLYHQSLRILPLHGVCYPVSRAARKVKGGMGQSHVARKPRSRSGGLTTNPPEK